LDFSRAHHVLTKVPAQIFGRAQVHFSAVEQRSEFQFDPSKAEESWRSSGLKFDEKIDVAVGSVGTSKNGPKQGQTPNPMPSAKIGESIVWKCHAAHRAT
jgi:hypothetical protein